MKKTLLTLLSLLFAGVTANAQEALDVTKVTGTYTGELYVAMGSETYDSQTLTNSAASVTLSAADEDGKVNFSLPDFKYMGMTLGTITLPNIGLVQNSKTSYVFAENDPVTLNLKLGFVPLTATASINSSKSYIEADSLVAYVPVTWTGNYIYVLFKGKNPTSGVRAVTTTTATTPVAIYDLQGRRVNATRYNLPAGLYIIDGKKTLVR